MITFFAIDVVEEIDGIFNNTVTHITVISALLCRGRRLCDYL